MIKIIFISDFFAEEYSGGAELSLESLIEICPYKYEKIKSNNVTKDYVSLNRDSFFIFGNSCNLKNEIRFEVIKNINYSIIEYDYKICKFRLPQAHIDSICNCINDIQIKLNLLWYSNSKINWFMSEQQLEYYIKIFPKFKKFNNFILNSSFSKNEIKILEKLDTSNKKNVWLIQDSKNWVKGTENSIKYAENNKLQYFRFDNLNRENMLKMFSEHVGFIFLPNGFDTCPRTIIEAKLLGCEIIMNEYVQHKNEEWFQTKEKIFQKLKTNKYYFWDKINEIK